MDASTGGPRHQDRASLRDTRAAFAGTGVIYLALDLVVLALVIVLLWLVGPGEVPAILIGGALGEFLFLISRARLRTRILAGADDPMWLTEGGPKLRQRLLREYSPVPAVLLTSPYFLAMAAYGLLSLPWPPVRSWEDLLGAGLFSAVAAAGLANGFQMLYFSWLVGRIQQQR